MLQAQTENCDGGKLTVKMILIAIETIWHIQGQKNFNKLARDQKSQSREARVPDASLDHR